jgi:hypothetical protein
MTVQLKFDDYILDHVSEWDDSVESRISETVVPRRHGTYHEETFAYGSRKITMRGTIFTADWESSRTVLRDFRQRLSGGTKKLYFDDDEYIYATMQNFSYQHRAGYGQGKVVDFSVSFICKDPFYYATSPTTVQDTYMITDDTIVVTNSGNIDTPPEITIIAGTLSSTNVRITNTHADINQYVEYTATLGALETLVINHDEATMEKESVGVLNDFAGDFFNLGVGSNTLIITFTGSSYIQCTVEHTDRRI